MKHLHLILLLLGSSVILGEAPVFAQEVSPAAGTPTASGASSEQKPHHLFAQLGLTEAQKEQLKQIHSSTTDKKERRQEMMAVLTPDQKAQLKTLMAQRRAQK